MKAKIAILLGLLLLGGMPLFAAAYMKISGIQGESTSPGHTGWIDLLSFGWGVPHPGTTAYGSGGGEGKSSFHDLSLTKKVDKASPALMNATVNGKHFPTVTIDMNGQHIDLQDVTIASYQKSGMGGGDGIEKETIKLNFVRDTFHDPAPPPNRGAVTGALVPAVQLTPNAT